MKQLLAVLFIGISFMSTAQHVGIGTSAPKTLLHAYNGSFLAGQDTTAAYAGKRIYWNYEKAAFSVGQNIQASGIGSIAMGNGAVANELNAIAIGTSNTASGQASTVLGHSSTASGYYSLAMGTGAIARYRNQIVLGTYNSIPFIYTAEMQQEWTSTDPIFSIGNGNSAFARSTALTVLKNGHIGLGTQSPACQLAVTGDIGLFGASSTFQIFSSTNSAQALLVAKRKNITAGEYAAIDIRGPNGTLNIATDVGFNADNTLNPNTGALYIYDGNGQADIMLQNRGGHGFIQTDKLSVLYDLNVYGSKNFVEPHPFKTDTNMVYTCLEGPEAGMYERGSATLTNGQAWVNFSDHFSLMGNFESLTVMLTPEWADTYGLAIVEKNETGFRVKELKQGQGNFNFTWMANCTRKGYENYKVYRSATDMYAQDKEPEKDKRTSIKLKRAALYNQQP